MHKQRIPRRSSRSWDGVAEWYLGWSGAAGSHHHRRLAIPAAMRLLDCRDGERVLDLGCGPGALAAHVQRRGARYTGVDLSPKLLAFARRQHPGVAFLEADVTRLQVMPALHHRFDAAVFLLSLQDIDPLDGALRSAAWALQPRGRLVLVMTHPCFRIPRQSGWGWDARRKLQYRRVDRYLTRLAVPMQPHAQGRGSTRSYHRPLSDYVGALAEAGLVLDALHEIPGLAAGGSGATAMPEGNADIPLFLALRARKTVR